MLTEARAADAADMFTIAGATVVDGTGAEAYRADVTVAAGRIQNVVRTGETPPHAVGRIVDLPGLVLTPGFIDIHSHADYTIMSDGRAHSSTMQGVTSIVTGNCGAGVAPLPRDSMAAAGARSFGWRSGDAPPTWETFGDYLSALRDRGVGPNVFPLVAHGLLRLIAAGFDERPLDQAERRASRLHLERAMQAGAAGMSSGLEYVPGKAASTEEICAIAEGMADFDALYSSHCRNRSGAMDAAAEEAVAIARAGRTRLQMSHFVRRPDGTAQKAADSWTILSAARADGMRVFADVFPFDYGPTPLGVLIPAALRSADKAMMAHNLGRPDYRDQVLAQMGSMFAALVKNGLVNSMYVADDGVDGNFNGKSVGQLATEWAVDPVIACYELLARAGADYDCVTIVENWARWSDLVEALASKDFYIMGDGATGSFDRKSPTMTLSDWGYAPRFLSRFIRDDALDTLGSAVHRMTEGPALQVGLRDRGAIKPGYAADLVALDLAALGTDVAPDNLRVAPTGISHVWVNGVPVVQGGLPTEARPGIVGMFR